MLKYLILGIIIVLWLFFGVELSKGNDKQVTIKHLILMGSLVFITIISFTYAGISSNSIMKSHHEVTNRTSKQISNSRAPRPIVTKWYSSKQIKSYHKINNNQYLVTLKNGKKLAANNDIGNPPTTKLLNEAKPIVVETDYFVSYEAHYGFIKNKVDKNVIIYITDKN